MSGGPSVAERRRSSPSPDVDVDPARPVKKKRKGGIKIPLKSKVNSLEQQMKDVQTSLNNLTSLLQRAVPDTSGVPDQGQSLYSSNTVQRASVLPSAKQPKSLEHWVQSSTNSFSNTIGNPPLPPSIRPDSPMTTQAESGSSSCNSSDEEGDEDKDHVPGLDIMQGMLRREETQRLREDKLRQRALPEYLSPPTTYNYSHPSASQQTSYDFGSNPAFVLRTQSTTQGDPIHDGIINESEGRHLFKLFFDAAHPFMPVFNPAHDTWDHLRSKSTFAFSAIMFVGKKVSLPGGKVDTVVRTLQERAEEQARKTLFSPISRIEALQAMILLASWGDTGWRPGAHCLSMAFDMGLFRCLPRLAKASARGSGAEAVSPAQASESVQKSLVTGARIWLLVCKMCIEMSYNHGKPLLIEWKTILNHVDALLEHPFALQSDSRLVSSCEMLLLRVPLHLASLSGDANGLDEALRHFNDGAAGWEKRWRQYYLSQGVSEHDLLLSDLSTQFSFSMVIANSALLRGVKDERDLKTLSHQRRQWLLFSLKEAQVTATRILQGEKTKLVGANHYSHVALASVARIYLRLAALFPETVNLRQAANDITRLADVLATFPGVSFAQRLRQVVRKARQVPTDIKARKATSRAQSTPNDQLSNVNAFVPPNSASSSQSPLDFDVILAEHMLSNALPERTGSYDSGMAQPSFDYSDFGISTFTEDPVGDWDQFIASMGGGSDSTTQAPPVEPSSSLFWTE